MADRLRLLNCIQQGQPGDISYDMCQYSISYDEARRSHISYREPDTKFMVINPFIELLKMTPDVQETELLLPYLLTDTFIPSYTYGRDYIPERTLNQLSWVIESLIFGITSKRFVNRYYFEPLTLEQKKTEVEKIKSWCEDNAALSPEALTINELRTATNWSSFYMAIQIAKRQKNDSLPAILVQRFNNFRGGTSWPSNRGYMAETMFELQNEKYVDVVRKWNKDTTDKWVNLWASMFLMKFDKDSYPAAIKALEAVLKQCNGITYYPHAIDFLLGLKDKNALKLAERIMDKAIFQQYIYWDYYENFIRKLLHAKSDYTFSFLSGKLSAYKLDMMKNLNKDGDNPITQNDEFVLAVDELKSDTPGYYKARTNLAKQEYIRKLESWFKTQYNLLKEGKPNELRLDIKRVSPPQGALVDSYYK